MGVPLCTVLLRTMLFETAEWLATPALEEDK